ncbi:MAG: TadE/TadG family type IV pilus assembly protein [Chloroflexota bacterium]
MFRADRDYKSPGQSLVELALVLPLAAMILFLSADFGRALTAYIQVGSAAREGAAYGMQSDTSAVDQAGIEAAALAESPSIWGIEPEVNSSTADCSDGYSRPDAGEPYDCVRVTVTYEFQPFITIWPVPDQIPMARAVEMRVVN